jgi:sugar phosphate isomerase/epimerase
MKTSADLLQLIFLVNSPLCGVIVDTGYFRSPAPYIDMAKAAPYVVNWQIKQSPFGTDGDVKLDLKRILHIISSSGYSGHLPVEMLSVALRSLSDCPSIYGEAKASHRSSGLDLRQINT